MDASNRIGVNLRFEDEDRRRKRPDEEELQVKALGLAGAYVQSAVEVVAASGTGLFAEAGEQSVARAASVGIYGKNQSIVSGAEAAAASGSPSRPKPKEEA